MSSMCSQESTHSLVLSCRKMLLIFRRKQTGSRALHIDRPTGLTSVLLGRTPGVFAQRQQSLAQQPPFDCLFVCQTSASASSRSSDQSDSSGFVNDTPASKVHIAGGNNGCTPAATTCNPAAKSSKHQHGGHCWRPEHRPPFPPPVL